MHLAEDPLLRRPVALKRLRRELGAQSDWVRRFHGEATAVARLGNPHVVQVFDLGRDHEEDFLVMELVEGLSLAALLARHDAPLPADAAAAIACQAASGLAAAHEAAVVHRDIKPDNILIRRDGTAKVADFGIARLVEEISRTMTGTVMGSPLYMAPEQIEGKTPTGALDVFALGSVLFRMLCGRTPFEAEHAHAAMWRIVSEPAPSVTAYVPGVDPALADLVERMLAKDPLQRPGAAEVSRALRQFLSAGGVADPVEFVRARVLPDDIRRAAPISASPRLVGGTLPDAPPRAPSPAPSARASSARRPLLWGAAAAGGFAMALLVAFLLLPGPRPQAVDAPPPSGTAENQDGSLAAPAPATPVPTAAPEKAAFLSVSVRDEAPEERNAFKPRLVFRNRGNRTIHAFRATWDIPGHADRSPVAEAYYSPGCEATLAPRPGGLRLTVSCDGLDLKPGQVHPGNDGIALGLHHRDWSPWGEKPEVGREFSTRTDLRIDIAL